MKPRLKRNVLSLPGCSLLCLCLLSASLPAWAGTPFHFTITADSRAQYANFAHTLSEINARVGGPGDFHISPGDVDPIYGNYAQVVTAFGASVTWYPALGNHDIESSSNVVDFRNLCTALPGTIHPGPDGTSLTAYSFDHVNAHFVVTNQYFDGTSETGTDGDMVDGMYNWLAADLNANTLPAVFVLGHEPAYPQNRHVGDSLDQYPANRDRFWSLLESKNVLAFIVGHTHVYSAIQPTSGKTWQIDVGNAGNDTSGDGLTFLDVAVSDCDVRYDIWRGATSGAMTLAQSIYQNLPACPTNTPTATPSDTPTPFPTGTPTDSPTPTDTETPTVTSTSTDTPTQTATSTPTKTPTPIPTATATHTASCTPTSSPTLPPTETATPTSTFYPKLIMAPNVLRAGQSARLWFDAPPRTCHWRIYTTAGELVGEMDFEGNRPNEWAPGDLASGFYIIRVQVEYAGGWTRDETFKVVVLH
jgi:hypothetical protein